jgi:hemerythrin superfamily protein
MSIFDKIAETIMPPETAEDRAEARRKFERLATGDDFVTDILAHHREIEQHFARARNAADAGSRKAAVKQLGMILTGHSQAEEAAIYPEIAEHEAKRHAAMGYQEQAMVKVEMALLEQLDPMSQEWRDKLEHIEGAVLHHVYQEEGTWYPKLLEVIPTTHRRHATQRYSEEFTRYMGEGHGSARQPVGDAPELA